MVSWYVWMMSVVIFWYWKSLVVGWLRMFWRWMCVWRIFDYNSWVLDYGDVIMVLSDMSEFGFIILIEWVVVKVCEFCDDEGNFELKLWVYIIGGGCVGFFYGFIFDEVVNEDDMVVVCEDVILLVDVMSI